MDLELRATPAERFTQFAAGESDALARLPSLLPDRVDVTLDQVKQAPRARRQLIQRTASTVCTKRLANTTSSRVASM